MSEAENRRFEQQKRDIANRLATVRATQNLVTRSSNPNLDRSLMDPAKVPPVQGRAMGPGMYFAPNEGVSERFWGRLGGNAYSPRVGMLDFLNLFNSRGYAGTEDLNRLGVRIQRGDAMDSPAVQRLMKEGYIGYRGNAAPDLSDAQEVTNWRVGAKNGLGLRKLPPGMGVNMGLGAANALAFIPMLLEAGRLGTGRMPTSRTNELFPGSNLLTEQDLIR